MTCLVRGDECSSGDDDDDDDVITKGEDLKADLFECTAEEKRRLTKVVKHCCIPLSPCLSPSLRGECAKV